MEINLIIYILLIHFLADFGLQTHKQATKKGDTNKWLAYHVGVYSLIWWIAFWVITRDFLNSLFFAGITFCTHFVTDYITARIGKPFWKNNDFHNGFVVVGFDQVLHYIQLIVTFNFLLT